MLRRVMMAGAGSSPGGDPHWASVVLRMRLDGNAIDEKGNAFTPYSSPTYGPGKWGDGLTSAGLASVYHSVPGFALSGDFTIELWAMMTPGGGGGALLSLFDVTVSPGWQIYCSSAGFIEWYQFNSGGSYPIRSTTKSISGQMRFIRISRAGTQLRMEVDGDLVGSATNSSAYTSYNCFLSIGYQAQGSARYPFPGVIDDIRITKGVSRFGEPVPTGPFPIS